MANYQVGTVETALVTKMDDATKELSKVLSGLKSLKHNVSATKAEIDKAGAASNKAGKAISAAFNVGKVYVALNYVRRYSRAMASVVKSSIDYVETVNKFKISMGSMYKDAIKFQNKINERFGLSKSILMDYQANFNNIIRGLGGIEPQIAYNLSETLTKMSVDFASLFNVSIEDAVTKFQAALTQQVRPIRSVSGFDITQQTLQGVLNQIGITDRTIAQLSQVEKRLVIIIALQKQMANVGAMSDFARTIEQPANQLKVMQQTLLDVKIAFGDFVLRYVAPALKYVNGFLMALKEILQTLSIGFGGGTIEEQEMPNLSDLLQPDNAASGVDKVKKSVKELKKAVLGMDELNIVNQKSDDGGGLGGGLGGLGGIDPRILMALQTYESGLEKVRMKATDIRDRIMEWLGFTQSVDKETGDVVWKLRDGYTKFEMIRDAVKLIGESIAVIMGGKALSKIITLLGGQAAEGTVIATVFSLYFAIKGVKDIFEGFGMLLDEDLSNDLDGFIKILTGTGGLIASFVALKFVLKGKDGVIALLTSTASKISVIGLLAGIAAGFVYDLIKNWDDMSPVERGIKILGALAAAATAAAIALASAHAAASAGLAAFAITAAVGAVGLAITGAVMKAKNIKGYAAGGFPTRGDYFLANENGKPEYVGSIGGKTAVANQNQIIEGISYGVSMAQGEQNRLLREQNALLQRLLAKGNDVYLDGRKVSDQLQRAESSRGYNSIGGQYAYI